MLPISNNRAIELLAEICREQSISADDIYAQANLSTGVEVCKGVCLRIINNVPFLHAINPIVFDTLKERYLIKADGIPTFSVPRLFIAAYLVSKLISLDVHYTIEVKNQYENEIVVKWIAGRKPGTWVGTK